MRILVVLTYYRPHTSGLTIYAERLAEAWISRGHQVTVLTSHYDKSLPLEEVKNGVKIIRVPVFARISKGVLMPTIGFIASKLVKEHDAVQLHLPQFDAAGIALRGRLWKKPTVITYHCDLIMPPGLMSWMANQAVHVMDHLAAQSTHRIVTYTRDYAENSPFLKRYLGKLKVIPPPVVLPMVPQENIKRFAEQNNPDACKPVIGMAARFATEKGVEVLIRALPAILERYPRTLIQFAGPYQNIIGEETYIEKLLPEIRKFEASGNWRFLGLLNPEDMSAFYPNLDLLVIPSLNSTEAFGLVQIEAMMNGVPSIASNLPGVRQPVKIHGMGKIIPIGDSDALAKDAIEILEHQGEYNQDKGELKTRYLPEMVANEYELLFEEIRSTL